MFSNAVELEFLYTHWTICGVCVLGDYLAFVEKLAHVVTRLHAPRGPVVLMVAPVPSTM